MNKIQQIVRCGYTWLLSRGWLRCINNSRFVGSRVQTYWYPAQDAGRCCVSRRVCARRRAACANSASVNAVIESSIFRSTSILKYFELFSFFRGFPGDHIGMSLYQHRLFRVTKYVLLYFSRSLYSSTQESQQHPFCLFFKRSHWICKMQQYFCPVSNMKTASACFCKISSAFHGLLSEVRRIPGI